MSSAVNNSKTLVLFDIDGTLTPSRLRISPEMEEFLRDLRSRVSVGLVGGSDLSKIAEQMGGAGENSAQSSYTIVNRYDYVFAENGLVAYKKGSLLATESIVEFVGEQKLQTFINFCLRYMSEVELPVKRGNFVEFRNGLVNICPVGRSCTQRQREAFVAYDAKHQIRQKFVDALNARFGHELDLRYAIGGQISFDCFPKGWDKTYCLRFVEDFDKIYFFGDKTAPGGNDYEIYTDPRTIGYTVRNPEHTIQIIKQLNF
jgi:phosphomannomutase